MGLGFLGRGLGPALSLLLPWGSSSHTCPKVGSGDPRAERLQVRVLPPGLCPQPQHPALQASGQTPEVTTSQSLVGTALVLRPLCLEEKVGYPPMTVG